MRRRSAPPSPTPRATAATRACVACMALALVAGEVLAQAPAPNPSQADIIRALQSPRRSLRVEPTAPAAVAPDASAGAGAAPANDAAAPAAATAPATNAGAGAIDLAILFEFGSAALTPAGRSALDTLAGALADPSLRDARIRIEGHTDAVGRPEANQRLSAERAASVRRYLVESRGIAGDRLVALGLGQTQLALPERPTDAANRRVRIVNLD